MRLLCAYQLDAVVDVLSKRERLVGGGGELGWKGTLRSMAAAARAAERDALRRQKLALKAEMISQSAQAVTAWEDYLEKLLSLHSNLADLVDWERISKQPRPLEPLPTTINGDNARRVLEVFRPRFFDFLRGGSAKVRQRLEEAVEAAVARDAEEYRQSVLKYEADLTEWELDLGLADKVLRGEASAIKTVIEEYESFSSEAMVGKSIEFAVRDNFVHAAVNVHADEIVPKFRRKQTASGKLSESKMPATQFNEFYQDYVVSAAMRVAGDLFQILPLPELYVTCNAMMLNTKSGHQELTPILSVQFVRETLSRLNLSQIDPSDALANFNHAMDFKKSKGFSAIQPLQALP